MPQLLLISVLAFVVAPALGNDDFPDIRNTQASGEHPPSPTEMLDLFELPPGFKVTLFAGEPDVQQPIAFDFDDLGRIWVAENYTYSARGKVDQQMRDRIIILHDKDGDGQHDERKVFWDKGRMLTGLTWGYGGLWILNDGTLSFIPDKDGNDIPDSEPVPMLNGWTKNAGHNVVNGLLWGPDGWLYGRHGITDTSYPGTIDTPKEERAPMNCGIWRFHPVKHTFEIVCHGTTNPWGLDYNEVGDMFMSNNVIGHLWHVVPGAHYQRMFGQDFNPHCYELMGPISDHYHWDESGKWNESRDGKADDLGGGHSHCGLMLYYGQNFPKEYWGKAFMCNTHGRCVNVDRIERKGSSYVAKHEPNFLKVNTPWFRGVEMKYGPAGCVYLTDWSDNGECHDHDGVHRTSGRIYRISYGEMTGRSQCNVDSLQIDKNDLEEAVATAAVLNGWRGRHLNRKITEAALSLGQTVSDPGYGYLPLGTELRSQTASKFALRVACDSLSIEECLAGIISPDIDIRIVAVKFAAVDKTRMKYVQPVLNSWLANYETEPRVFLSFLAESLRPDSPLNPNYAILKRIAGVASDDSPLELMTFYAAEANYRTNPNLWANQLTWLALVEDVPPRLRQMLSRRMASEPTSFRGVNSPASALLGYAASSRQSSLSKRLAILDGMTQGALELRQARPPDHWEQWLAIFAKEKIEPEVTQRIQRLDTLFGGRQGRAAMLEQLSNRNGDPAIRSSSIRILAETKDNRSELIPTFLSVLNDKAVYVDICKALAAFDDDPRIPKELLKRWNSLRHGAQEAAADTLSSRRSYAIEFTKAIADGRVDSNILTAVQVRQLNAFNDESIIEIIDEHWGVINETPEALEASIATWKKDLNDEVLAKADLKNGAALFNKSCATCHKLYGEGGQIGPDLTGGNRANLDYLLSNIINPSGEVPKQYTVSIVELKSGQVVTGVVVGETEQVINIQTAKELRTIATSNIQQRTRTSQSLMPNGLLDTLKADEVRDLVAFLRHRR